MTLQELKKARASMLGPELSGEELMTLEEGMVLYGGTVANGKAPKDTRAVLTSGFRFVANVSDVFGVDCLGITRGGYASIFTYGKHDLEGARFLFRTRPLEHGGQKSTITGNSERN